MAVIYTKEGGGMAKPQVILRLSEREWMLVEACVITVWREIHYKRLVMGPDNPGARSDLNILEDLNPVWSKVSAQGESSLRGRWDDNFRSGIQIELEYVFEEWREWKREE